MAIIKYRVEATVTRTDTNADRNVMGSIWQYEEIYHPGRKGRVLTREQALKMIEESGLVRVFSNKYGAVWDEPNEPMRMKFQGYFSSKVR